MEKPTKISTDEFDKKNIEMLLEYQRTKDFKIRNNIVMYNIDLIHYVASRIKKQYVFTDYEYSDLVSMGSLGMLRAIELFQVDKGKFSGYAFKKIHGKILDEIRSQDWCPRSVRSKMKAAKVELAYVQNNINFNYELKDIYKQYNLTDREYNLMTGNCFISYNEINVNYQLEYHYE